MRRANRVLWQFLVLPVLLALSGRAQVQYVLEAVPAAQLSAVTSKYSLLILKSWVEKEHSTFVVSSSQALPPALVALIRKEPGVLDFELDVRTRSAESEPASKAQVALDSLGDVLSRREATNYYGATVRAGYANQPAGKIINLDDAHHRFGLGSGLVAVIDTGVDPNHPALRSVLVPGYDFTRDQSGPASELADLTQSTVAILDQSTVAILDTKRVPVVLNQSTVAILDQSTVAILDTYKLPKSFGHGTMVAGLIHWVAPGARIMPLKAFRADGSAQLSDIVRAIRYAADCGADVISMSFSLTAPSADLQSAIAYAASKGSICVASAGNEGRRMVVYPASLRKTIGVGSTNRLDRRSPFSNFGNAARTAAPGEALITTYPGNNYAGVWGTSFSTALVSGSVALMRQLAPKAQSDRVKDALDNGIHIEQEMGDARLDLRKSLEFLLIERD